MRVEYCRMFRVYLSGLAHSNLYFTYRWKVLLSYGGYMSIFEIINKRMDKYRYRFQQDILNGRLDNTVRNTDLICWYKRLKTLWRQYFRKNIYCIVQDTVFNGDLLTGHPRVAVVVRVLFGYGAYKKSKKIRHIT